MKIVSLQMEIPNEYFLYFFFYGSALILFILPSLVLTVKFIQDCRRHRQQEMVYGQIRRAGGAIYIQIEHPENQRGIWAL
uniref:Uncharacterized protein n=1 Tax=Steinernema glaseri TaxID=37863 RepID=A0A1I7Z2D4_9BILA